MLFHTSISTRTGPVVLRPGFISQHKKRKRAGRRKIKAAKLAPRPASGPLRPVVHCPTQKYNSKLRLGRGFSVDELKDAGISRKLAKTIGISVDYRRTNKSVESLQLNVQRLKEYKSRLIIFPRKGGKIKNGDSSKEECSNATQLKGPIISIPKAGDAVTFTKITEDMKKFTAYCELRAARTEASLVGIRKKKAAEKKDELALKKD
mmetsp:Transcript_18228/g.18293  ORF Transcript_18228/g.18293 Transcript_18228/m.18293 type:complete len:206 (-) Transcript_18228:61-678(-)